MLNTLISVNTPVVLTATLAPEAARAIILTCLQVVGLLYPICRSNSCQRCCSRRSVGGLTPPNNSETDELTGVEQVVINGKTYLLVDQDGSNGGYQHVLDTIVTIARSFRHLCRDSARRGGSLHRRPAGGMQFNQSYRRRERRRGRKKNPRQGGE